MNLHYLHYKTYAGSSNYSPIDMVWHGKILQINDLVTYESDTRGELQAAFEQAVDDYIKTCDEIGKQPDKPKNL